MSAAIERDALKDVVGRAATGDVAAFAKIVAAHHDDMARVAFLITRDVDLAQDAVQIAWPIVWRKIGSVREPERLRAWLIAVAANEARSLIQRRQRRSVREIAIDPTGRETLAADRGLGPHVPDVSDRAPDVDLHVALSHLSPDERSLLGMRYAAGLSSAEIGVVLGISAAGVRGRLMRLIHRLREELADD